MMLEPAMKELLEYIPSRYMLVNVAAQRARRISEEAREREEPLNAKPVSIAIQDIAAGKVSLERLESELSQMPSQNEDGDRDADLTPDG